MPGNPAEAARAGALGRLTRAFPWVGLVLAVLIFYWVEASLRKSPWLFTDELEWSQLSRAIASTGEAARRGQPHSFESLYSYLIAPAWWLHSTAAAYAAIKYLDAVVMCLAAVPTYLLARMLVPRGSAVVVALLSIAIPAMSYATSIVPEPLAYPWFATGAYLAVRALAAPRARTAVPAAVFAAVGPFVRQQFVSLPAVLVLAAAIVWVGRSAGGRTLRSRWRPIALSAAGLVVFAYVFNRLVVEHVQTWSYGQYLNHRTFHEGRIAVGALAVGLGMFPLIAGLASLRLPERAKDPAYLAFAAYLGAAAVTLSLYTAAKATYLSGAGNLTSLVEERNVFFLSPLLLIGTALVLTARRVSWALVAAATALALFAVWPRALEVGGGYFEAPGLSILTLVNVSFIWTVEDVHAMLAVAAAVGIGALLLRRIRWVPAIAAALTCAWLLTGEIYATHENSKAARSYETYLPPPRAWVDAATHGAHTTLLGEQMSVGPQALLLTEFWNRTIDHVMSLDGTASGPGPVTTPYLETADGKLSDYTGNRYTLAGFGFHLAAPVVATHPGGVGGNFTLYSTPGPWRLLDETFNVYPDGWAVSPFAYTYLHRGGPGVLRIQLSRTAYNGPGLPGEATVTVGTVRLDANGDAELGRRLAVRHALLHNGQLTTVSVHVDATPVRVVVAVKRPIVSPGDSRLLAAQPAFRFFPDR